MSDLENPPRVQWTVDIATLLVVIVMVLSLIFG